MPSASYLFGRAKLGKPIDSEKTIARLSKADATLKEAREAFPFGRGNVDIDIANSDMESGRRQRAVRDMFDVLTKNPHTRALFTPRLETRAALAQFIQGGNCAEYASVATVVHAPKLAPDETIHQVGHPPRRHEWAESRVPEGHDQTLVIDPWAYGPAVLAEDSEFAQRQHDTRRSFDKSSAEALPARMAERMDFLDEKMGPSVETHLDGLKESGLKFVHGLWQPQSVLSTAFHAALEERAWTNRCRRPKRCGIW